MKTIKLFSFFILFIFISTFTVSATSTDDAVDGDKNIEELAIIIEDVRDLYHHLYSPKSELSGSLNPLEKYIEEGLSITETMYHPERKYYPKIPALAFILSFLFPGGGQYYNGEFLKGAIMTGICATSIVFMTVGLVNTLVYMSNGYYEKQRNNEGLLIAGAVIFSINYFYSLIDAPICSIKINEARFGNSAELQVKPTILNDVMHAKVSPKLGMGLSLKF